MKRNTQKPILDIIPSRWQEEFRSQTATHVLEHGPDGEPRRQSGGKVFERVDHQVDPAEDKQETKSDRSSIISAAA